MSPDRALLVLVGSSFTLLAAAAPVQPPARAPAAPRPPAVAAPPPATPPAPTPRQLRRRPLRITDANATEIPEVLIAAGVPTTLVFRNEIDPAHLVLADMSGAFTERTRATAYSVLLSPTADIPPTSVATLQVRLKDGTFLPFLLRTAPDVVDLQVDIEVAFQERAAPESVAALKSTLEQARSDLADCRANSAEVAVSKIAALINAEPPGPQVFEHHEIRKIDKQHRLYIQAQQVFRMFGYTYMVLTIEGRGLPSAWTLGAVDVAMGERGKEQPLKTDALNAEPTTIGATDTMRVVVAFRPPANIGTDTRFTVTLSESNGTRHIRLDDVRL